MFVPGASAKFFNAPITPCNPRFSVGVRINVRVPASIAGLISGNAARNSADAGVRFRPNVVRSTNNGCWARNDAVPVDNVAGDSAIVCANAFGSELIARNVVAASPNNRTFTCATGANAAMNKFKSFKNRGNATRIAPNTAPPAANAPTTPASSRSCHSTTDPRPANTSPAPTKLR